MAVEGMETDRLDGRFVTGAALAVKATGLASTSANFGALLKLEPSKPLVLLEGDRKMLGSTFSLSKSSNGSGDAARRFVGALKAGFSPDFKDWLERAAETS